MHQENNFKLAFSKQKGKECSRKFLAILIKKFKISPKVTNKIMERKIFFLCSNPPSYTNS
jgi:hypothetical protein